PVTTPAPLSFTPPLGAVSVTTPEPPAVTAALIVSLPASAVRLMLPVAAVVIAPVVVTAPVLVTATLPPPVSLIPVIVSGLAVFVRLTSPLVVFVALKRATVLAPFSVCPVTELVVSVPPVLKSPPPPSVIALPELAVIDPPLTAAFTASGPPVAVSVTTPVPPAVTGAPIVSAVLAVRLMLPVAAVVIAPVVVTAPVLVTATLPPPVSLIPVIVSGLAAFTRLTSP